MVIKRRSLPLSMASFTALLLIFVQAGWTQDLRADIERDVWIPLFKGSDSFDAELFLSVQSKDLVRVAVDQKLAYGFTRYSKEIRDGFRHAKERKIVGLSEARFLERKVEGDYAFETGYFRSEVSLPGGEKRVRFSHFEFMMRREMGKWRVLVDRDTSAGPEISESAYLQAAPMVLRS